MKKGSIFTIVVIGILAVLFLIRHEQFGSDEFSYEQSDWITQNQIEPEFNVSKLSSKNQIADISNDASTNSADSSRDKMDYASDWCIAVTDLVPEDASYFQLELEDWYLSRGRIHPPYGDGSGSDSSQYLVPYMDSAHDDIRKQIKDDNAFAMIAALYRQDFDLESQRRIAQRLVVKGHTATALSRLVTIELINASSLYENAGGINSEIERSLYRTLAYVAYGIEHFDLDAASAYLRIISSEDFPVELIPSYSLAKDNKINEYFNKLEEIIDNSRVRENVTSGAKSETPKAAKHNFEGMLARLYFDYGNEINNLKVVLPDSTSEMLESSECVEKHILFFGSHGLKRVR